jgi:hypothetical protein
MPPLNVFALCALLIAGCATGGAPAAEAPSPSEEVAGSAVRGAGKGALVCLLPMGVGGYFGPIGFAAGAYVSLLCMPFGIVGGALSGALSATAN